MEVRWHQARLIVCIVLALSAPAAAQNENVMARARDAASSGRRPEALSMLESHLVAAPRDVDARLVYGLILSWEGRYEDARRELRHVLEQAPRYADARVALMNVEWWSGRNREAREAADAILAREPGNQQARSVRERLEAASRPWWVGASYSVDSFNDDQEAWHESSLSLTRMTPVGSLIFRGSEARRFGFDDQLFEIEFYPRFRPGSYAFIGAGSAPDSALYPARRFAFDLYQAVGRGFEVSGGYRRLEFSEVTNIYVGSVSKYLGNWMITGKVFHVPGAGPLDSTSYHGAFRRYLRGDGTSYLGATYSHGFSREEIRNVADLTTVDSDTVRLEANQLLGRRVRLFQSGGTSRQERQNRVPLWQTSISGGLMVQF